MVADITVNPLPTADLILCRDCLVHLSFAHIDAALANFRASGARWLLTTTFPMIEENVDCEDGDWRALNLTLPPFCWLQLKCSLANHVWRPMERGVTKASAYGHLRQPRPCPGGNHCADLGARQGSGGPLVYSND